MLNYRPELQGIRSNSPIEPYNPNFPSSFYSKARSLKRLFDIKDQEDHQVYLNHQSRIASIRYIRNESPVKRSLSKHELINKILTKRHHSPFTYQKAKITSDSPEEIRLQIPKIRFFPKKSAKNPLKKTGQKASSLITTPKPYYKPSTKKRQILKKPFLPTLPPQYQFDNEPLTGW